MYSYIDETVDLTPPPAPYPELDTLLVGQTVVGESRPLAKSEFGLPPLDLGMTGPPLSLSMDLRVLGWFSELVDWAGALFRR